MERSFQGIWIPVEILELGLIEIIKWVDETYKVNLQAEFPMGDES